MTSPEPSYLDDDHQRIVEFAADFLDEDEADSFIEHLMERRGYTRTHSWAPPDPGGHQGGAGDQDDDGGRGRAPGGRGRSAPTSRQPRRAPYFKR